MKAAGRGWMRESLRHLDYAGDLRRRHFWGNGSHFARSSFILAKQNAYPHIRIATLFSESSVGEFCLSTEAAASSHGDIRIRHFISNFGSKILACTMPKWLVSAVKHKKLSFVAHLAVMNHRSRLSVTFNHPWAVRFLVSCDLFPSPFPRLGLFAKAFEMICNHLRWVFLLIIAWSRMWRSCAFNRYQINLSC
jgi:hypothetical protein